MPHSPNQPHAVSSKLRLFIVVAIAGVAGVYATSIFREKEATTYAGYLAAETSVIVADRHAEIQQLHVSEGEEVEPQKLIATLIDLEHSQQVLKLAAALQQNRLQIERAEAQVDIELTWRTRAIETDLHQTQIESAGFFKKQLDLKMEKLVLNKRLPQMRSQNKVRQSAFTPLLQEVPKTEKERLNLLLQKEANQNAAEVTEVQLDICEQRIKRLNSLLEKLPAQVERSHNLLSLKSESAKLQKELKQMQRYENTEGVKVRSSAYGTIGIIHKSVGEKVTTGEPLAMLLDQQQRYLIVHVPSTEIDRFTSDKKERAKLTLTFSGGMTRTGIVHSIPPQAEKVREGNNAASLQVVKVRVTPIGKPWPQLPIGSQVDVQLQK